MDIFFKENIKTPKIGGEGIIVEIEGCEIRENKTQERQQVDDVWAVGFVERTV